MANYRIQNLRPYLRRNLVDYERTKFQEILEETPSKYHAILNLNLYLKIGLLKVIV